MLNRGILTTLLYILQQVLLVGAIVTRRRKALDVAIVEIAEQVICLHRLHIYFGGQLIFLCLLGVRMVAF